MYSLGIDIGGTTVKAGIVTEEGKLIHKVTSVTAKESPAAFVKGIAELAVLGIEEAGLKMSDISAVGTGFPGSVDIEAGVAIDASNLGIKNLKLVEELKKYLQVPVVLNNDANLAALAEFHRLKDSAIDSFIMITLGTGIGGGIIIDGEIYAGHDGNAGEFGHTMLCMDGIRCSCGRRGCWEAYASASALSTATQKAAKENPKSVLNTLIADNHGKADGEILFRALNVGDSAARKVFSYYIKYLGEGLINIINVFQPHTIVIGGGLSNSGEALLTPLRKYIAENSDWMQSRKPTQIKKAELGNEAGIIGAAVYAWMAKLTERKGQCVSGQNENTGIFA